jgi:ketosteroid isomerase-like protein
VAQGGGDGVPAALHNIWGHEARAAGSHFRPGLAWLVVRMIFSEDRYPLFGIMRAGAHAPRPPGGNMAKSKRKAKSGKAKSTRKSKSARKSNAVSVAGLKRAIEGRKASALAGLYADDAVVQVIDRDNPPSKPRRLQGRSDIAAYFADVCGRDMTHKLESGVTVGNRLAFTQSCAYPDGTKVFCSAMADLKGGKIVRQTVVQAWDG